MLSRSDLGGLQRTGLLQKGQRSLTNKRLPITKKLMIENNKVTRPEFAASAAKNRVNARTKNNMRLSQYCLLSLCNEESISLLLTSQFSLIINPSIPSLNLFLQRPDLSLSIAYTRTIGHRGTNSEEPTIGIHRQQWILEITLILIMINRGLPVVDNTKRKIEKSDLPVEILG